MTRDRRGVAVPTGRFQRAVSLGSVVGGIAINSIGKSVAQRLRGEEADLRAVALTAENAGKLASQLATMRGAAMKLGQLLSMEVGDVIPAEFASALAILRYQADPMPPRQVRQVLTRAWGRDWLKQFKRFDAKPMAAASIGQVHRGIHKDGREMAFKVQFPGVRDGIDHDIDNVGSIIRVSGMLPKDFELRPFLDEAKAQLKRETDYGEEAHNLERFAKALSGSNQFSIPRMHADYSTNKVLAMDFVPSDPIESVVDLPQVQRDALITDLFSLLFMELFELRLIQSDPNPGNYRYDRTRSRIVLLDFGAVQTISPELSENLKALLVAGRDLNREAIEHAASRIGYIDEHTTPPQKALVLDALALACTPLRSAEPYDFSNSNLTIELAEIGNRLGFDAGYRTVPPMEVLYLHRKFAGVFLLAKQFKARVDFQSIASPYLDGSR